MTDMATVAAELTARLKTVRDDLDRLDECLFGQLAGDFTVQLEARDEAWRWTVTWRDVELFAEEGTPDEVAGLEGDDLVDAAAYHAADTNARVIATFRTSLDEEVLPDFERNVRRSLVEAAVVGDIIAHVRA